MEPTFYDQDFFIVDKISLFFREPKRGEFLQFNPPNKTEVAIKRVIALPGEQVAIKPDGVYIKQVNSQDWEKLDESYLANGIRTKGANDEEDVTFLTIPEYSYFLMGDNRPMSGDSRAYGAVHRSDIYGLAKIVSFANQ